MLHFLNSKGYHSTEADPCVLHKHIGHYFIIIAVFSDDFIAATNHKPVMTNFTEAMQSKYGSNLKRLGFPAKNLGWEIHHTPSHGVLRCQELLSKTVLSHACMAETIDKPTPYPSRTILHPTLPNEPPITDHHANYRQLVGDLRYLADTTRPDLAMAASKLGGANHAPTARHFSLLKSTLRYLQSHRNLALSYHSGSSTAGPHISVRLYSDSDWANDASDRKSHAGAAVYVNKCLVAWTSR